MHCGKILVVDDDWKMRNLVRIYLNKDGYEVVEAVSGDEALQLLTEQSFHLILLDIMMRKNSISCCFWLSILIGHLLERLSSTSYGNTISLVTFDPLIPM